MFAVLVFWLCLVFVLWFSFDILFTAGLTHFPALTLHLPIILDLFAGLCFNKLSHCICSYIVTGTYKLQLLNFTLKTLTERFGHEHHQHTRGKKKPKLTSFKYSGGSVMFCLVSIDGIVNSAKYQDSQWHLIILISHLQNSFYTPLLLLKAERCLFSCTTDHSVSQTPERSGPGTLLHPLNAEQENSGKCSQPSATHIQHHRGQ